MFLFLLLLLLVLLFPLFLARETECKREKKKAFFIPRKINSSSLTWASYCSSALGICPNEEADIVCFAEVFVKF